MKKGIFLLGSIGNFPATSIYLSLSLSLSLYIYIYINSFYLPPHSPYIFSIMNKVVISSNLAWQVPIVIF